MQPLINEQLINFVLTRNGKMRKCAANAKTWKIITHWRPLAHYSEGTTLYREIKMANQGNKFKLK